MLSKILILFKKNISFINELLVVFTILFFGLIVFANNKMNFDFFHNGDVHRGFHRGIDYSLGINSYKAFNPENMLTQEKVPGFFPLYFYVMGFFVWISDYSFIKFIDNLRIFTFIFYSTIGVFIYLKLRNYSKIFAVLGMIFFMFNRWTLLDVLSLKQESYVLLLFISSLIFLQKRTALSFFFLGLATGIKHLTILVFPLYLYTLFIDKGKMDLVSYFKSKKLLKHLVAVILFLAPIILPSISYFMDDSNRFINAILFNITRESESELGVGTAIGLEKVFVLYNQDLLNYFLLILPRAPMLLALILINTLLIRGVISKWVYCFLTYLSFICFNPTLYNQYMVWFFVFIPFIFSELVATKRSHTISSSK